MTHEELKVILENHRKWLNDDGGERADLTDAYLWDADLTDAYLRDADLRRADLRDANLRDADLRDADLRDADLRDANLRDADLRDAYLRDANLRDANLRDANLRGADLRGAYLWGAYLWDADLTGANLMGAYLTGAYLKRAKLPRFQIPQCGELRVWKAGDGYTLIDLLIPSDARRTASLVNRKCRAERALVMGTWECENKDAVTLRFHRCDAVRGWHKNSFEYRRNVTVTPDEYDDDIRVECSNGIHFFLTLEEALDFASMDYRKPVEFVGEES